MIKIDLVTGFLGSGKTTFIKLYAKYLMQKGYKIGIIENDYGAVNVDMMLLQDALDNQCDLEMISGGSDKQTHQRRLKTKLIAMGMLGYDRIIIEPSGIYDVDEFFDTLYEEPLNNWYEVGNVITIIDAKLDYHLSKQSQYIFASEIASAGKIVLSKTQDVSKEKVNHLLNYINQSLKAIQCHRQITDEFIDKNWNDFTEDDYELILTSGYIPENYQKLSFNDIYSTLYFMNINITQDQLYNVLKNIFEDNECGKIFRIKGFIHKDNEEWLEVNATKKEISMKPIHQGQEVIIVIGENLVKDKIEEYINERRK